MSPRRVSLSATRAPCRGTSGGRLKEDFTRYFLAVGGVCLAFVILSGGETQLAVAGQQSEPKVIKDGTGKLLAEFAQKRIGAMGAFGGESPSTQ